jgi:hypothetical protein
MKTYRYRLRAVNPLGNAVSMPVDQATTPPSFGMTVDAGRRRARDGSRKDSLLLSGTWARTGTTEFSVFDPRQVSVQFLLQGSEAPVAAVDAGGTLWKSKKGKWILKYPYSPYGRFSMVVDPAASTWTMSLKKCDLPDYAGPDPERVRMIFRRDGAFADIPWRPLKKAGDHRYP